MQSFKQALQKAQIELLQSFVEAVKKASTNL